MRLPGISLFAIISILVISGCSANRNAVRDDRADDQPYIPPRHDHDYSPEINSPQDELQSPVPPVPSGEPIPAPPAFGISRIKSVSWLKRRESKASVKSTISQAPCGASDEPQIGQCTPIESCVPQHDVSASERVPRYQETRCGEGCAERVSPLQRLSRAFKKFRHPHPADSCSESCTDSARDAQPPVHTGKSFSNSPECADGPGGLLHANKKPRCLADSLDEPYSEDTDPGLITPDDAILPSPEREIPRAPALQQVPTVPTIPKPKGFQEPVPGVPVPPAPLGPSTQIVEPPLWPRLGTRHFSSPVSSTVVSPPPTPARSVQTFDMPQIVPGAHRRPQSVR